VQTNLKNRKFPSQLVFHHDLCLINKFISSTNVFSATGRRKSSASATQSQPPRASQAPESMMAHAEVPAVSFNRASDDFQDPMMRQQQTFTSTMGGSASAGRNFQYDLQSGADLYGQGYPVPPDIYSAQGQVGRGTNVGCNVHANIPTYRIQTCGCGCRLALSPDGNVVAILEEGVAPLSPSGGSMMASSSRGGQSDMHAAHTSWGGQSSSSSNYPGSMNQWNAYNYPTS